MSLFKRYAAKNLQKSKEKLARGLPQEANKYARKAVRLDPGLADAWLILAATSNKKNSIYYLNEVLNLDPENEKAQKGLKWALTSLENEHTSKDLSFTKYKKSEYDSNNGHWEEKNQSSRKNNGRLINRVFSRWQTVLAIALFLLILLIALIAPLIAPLDDNTGSKFFKIACDRYHCVPEPPSSQFPLGTVKEFDVYHTLIWGTRQALTFGLMTAIITGFLGTMLGTIAAYTGGWLDKAIMRVCDAFLAFPIIAAVALFAQIIALLTPSSPGLTLAQFNAIPEQFNFFQKIVTGTEPILLALILFSWMPYARIIHTQVLQIKQAEFIEAALAVGARHRCIIWRHLLPNSISPAVVMATRDVGRLVVIQSSLTFINVGGSSSWATILNIGKDWIIGPGGNLFTRWWIYLPITIAVVVFGISWSIIGDEINHWLNPRNVG